MYSLEHGQKLLAFARAAGNATDKEIGYLEAFVNNDGNYTAAAGHFGVTLNSVKQSIQRVNAKCAVELNYCKDWVDSVRK